jgi:hypothetical protein
VEWYDYGKMESLATRGGAPLRECHPAADGQEVDVGDLALTPALRLHGKVVLSDGRVIPPAMRITISSDRAFDSQTAILARDGSFAFCGLARGSYRIFASVRGYHSASRQPLTLTLNSDVTDYMLTLSPQ